MAQVKRSRTPRRFQFGLTLSERAAELLRREAERLKLRPTTLAAQLLGQALEDRLNSGDDAREQLESLQVEIQALTRAHHNSTLKLLRTAGGMAAAEVADWAKRFLGEHGPPPRRADAPPSKP